MARAIVIPLYDHTPDDEIREIMDRLDGLGFAMSPIVVSGYICSDDVPSSRGTLVAMAELTKAIPGRPGWRIDHEGREWYSAAWLALSVPS